jgi:glycosyltransferase involved in cell wall biosynthesis
MVIAINTLFYTKESEVDFQKKMLVDLIALNPEHSFLIISEEKYVSGNSNTTEIFIGKGPSGLNHWSFWLYFKIRKIIKSYKPDVLINNGEALLHFKNTPQIIFNPELKYLKDSSALSTNPGILFKFFARRYYQKANNFIVFSEFEKNFLKNKFEIKEDRIHVLEYGADKDIKPVNWEEREIIKNKYAKGFEFFLYLGNISTSKNLLTLLKAFSVFKKRQRSSMQLIFAGKKGVLFNDFKKMVELYKYKNDVHIIEECTLQENENILSSAYALVFPDQFDKSIHAMFTALKYEVPSIVPKTGSLSEAGGDSVLHFEAGNVPDLAGKMMLLFKEEKYRKNLIQKSKNWVDQKNFQFCIEETWEIIKKTGIPNRIS